jgi:subtilisin family serine protease
MLQAFLRAIFIVVIASFGISSQAFAQRAAAGTERAVFIEMKGPASVRQAAAAELLTKARARGQVRVIVGLTVSLRPAASLNEIEAATQTARLRSAQGALATRLGVRGDDVTTFDTIPFVSMWVNAAQLNRLVNDLGVVNIQEDVPGTAALNKSAVFIHAPQVWQQGFTGNGFVVAVLDTGVDKGHPMLLGRVVSEACYSTNNAGQGVSSFCPGRATKSIAVNSGLPCPGNLDPCWHGTHVASTAAGKAAQHGPVVLRGIGYGAKLIAIKVFSKQGASGVVTFPTDWIRGLERVFALVISTRSPP